MEVLAITALVAAAGTAALIAIPLIRRRGGKNRTQTSDDVDWNSGTTKTKTNTRTRTKTRTKTRTALTPAYYDPVMKAKFKEQLAYETAEIKALDKLRQEFILDPPAKPEELVAHEKAWEATLSKLTRKSIRKHKTKTKAKASKLENNGFDEGSEANQYKMKFRRATRKRATRQ